MLRFALFLCPLSGLFAVDFLPAAVSGQFPDATASRIIRFACAPDPISLRPVFNARRLPMDARLIHERQGRWCHIYYEPTIPGFRASTDGQPIQEIYMDLEKFSFLGTRRGSVGDSLDIAKQVLPHLPRPLKFHFGLPLKVERRWFDEAMQFHFPRLAHDVVLRDNRSEDTNPWVQDYLKSGSVNGQHKVLITRSAFEGRAEFGAKFRPILDSFEGEHFVRSQLSWEGGDIQFAPDPRDASRIIMFHGDSASLYWGQDLSPAEYQWILKVEFGADEAVDLSNFVPHVDYLVCSLAKDNIILLAEPMRENYEIARAALDIAMQAYGPEPPEEIRALDRLMPSREAAFGANVKEIRKTVGKARRTYVDWNVPVSGSLAARLEAFASEFCPADINVCVNAEGVTRLLESHKDLFHDWMMAGTKIRILERLFPAVLSIIESNLPGYPAPTLSLIDARTRRLEALGFRVIRIPRIGGRTGKNPWAGISYANSTLVDNVLFVPQFGLGDAETAIFTKMRESLPPHYKVVPVYARQSLTQNGGVHCVMSFIRR